MKRSSTKFVQIMPLGFSIIGSTVTFDLFLRWATQGPLGPLVYNEIGYSSFAIDCESYHSDAVRKYTLNKKLLWWKNLIIFTQVFKHN